MSRMQLKVDDLIDAEVLDVLPLTAEDRKDLQERGPHHSAALVTNIRYRHHAIARLMAAGLKDVEIIRRIGGTSTNLSILKTSPAFRELVEHYKGKADDRAFDLREQLEALASASVDELMQRITEKPEEVGTRTLERIAMSAADRVGHSPVRRNENLNLHLGLRKEDIAQIKERARARQQKAQEEGQGVEMGSPAPVISVSPDETSWDEGSGEDV